MVWKRIGLRRCSGADVGRGVSSRVDRADEDVLEILAMLTLTGLMSIRSSSPADGTISNENRKITVKDLLVELFALFCNVEGPASCLDFLAEPEASANWGALRLLGFARKMPSSIDVMSVFEAVDIFLMLLGLLEVFLGHYRLSRFLPTSDPLRRLGGMQSWGITMFLRRAIQPCGNGQQDL